MRLQNLTLGLLFSCVSVFYACTTEPSEQNIPAKKAYFDLRGYFNNEIQKLQNQNPWVEKTAQSGDKSTSKKLKITDWKQELSVFSDADINKSSWIGYFKVDSNAFESTYTSTKAEIPVKILRVVKDSNQHIQHIHLVLGENNVLYHANDTLDYYPNERYQIHKWQKTKMLNESKYWVKGLILKP